MNPGKRNALMWADVGCHSRGLLHKEISCALFLREEEKEEFRM